MALPGKRILMCSVRHSYNDAAVGAFRQRLAVKLGNSVFRGNSAYNYLSTRRGQRRHATTHQCKYTRRARKHECAHDGRATHPARANWAKIGPESAQLC